jgi:hypothetical protein
MAKVNDSTLMNLAGTFVDEAGMYIHAPIPGQDFLKSLREDVYLNNTNHLGFSNFGGRNLTHLPELDRKGTKYLFGRVLGDKSLVNDYHLPEEVSALHDKTGSLKFIRQHSDSGFGDYWRVSGIESLRDRNGEIIGPKGIYGNVGDVDCEECDFLVIEPIQKEVKTGIDTRVRKKRVEKGIFRRRIEYVSEEEEFDVLNLEGVHASEYLLNTNDPNEPIWNAHYRGLTQKDFDNRPGNQLHIKLYLPESQATRFADISDDNPRLIQEVYKLMAPKLASHPFTAPKPSDKLLYVRDKPNNLSEMPRSLEKIVSLKDQD